MDIPSRREIETAELKPCKGGEADGPQVAGHEPDQAAKSQAPGRPHFGGVGRKWQQEAVKLPAPEILSIVGMDGADPRAAAFIAELEDAVQRATIRASWKPKATDIIKPLQQAMEAAEQMLTALDSIPHAGQPYFLLGGLMWGDARRQASDMRDAAIRACDLASKQLAGRGNRVADSNPDILAAEVAEALRQIGVKVTAYKVNYENQNLSPFMAVAEICFVAAKLAHCNTYQHLNNGRNAKITD